MVKPALTITDPEVALALLHAPAAARADLTALFALDARLGGIVARTREPMLAAIKLAWWRERLAALPVVPRGEPMLAALAAGALAPPRLERLVTSWETVLDGEAVAGHRARGAAVFEVAGARLGAAPEWLGAAGATWALVDAARHGAATLKAAGPVHARWPRGLRPLGMLALLAAGDARAGSLPPRGTPGRALRMIRHRLTGR